MKQLYLGASSACFELNNPGAYYAPRSYQVSLNGEKVMQCDTNVFSLFDLWPDTDYRVEVQWESERRSIEFHTPGETCALSVKDFGAKGDGIQDDTAAIQTAISMMPAGGRLIVPEGSYLCRPLSLKSHMVLELQAGARLIGWPDRSAYPVIPANAMDYNTREELNFGGFEGNAMDMYQSLITAAFCEDIAIVGRGTVDGNAQNTDFWTNFRNFAPARPRLLFFNRCRNVWVHGITACNSPSWQLHPYYSRELGFYDIQVLAPKDSPNTDALDPEACDRVEIIGCKFSVGDDCIAIKSGKIEMGIKYRQPASNHTVRNCLMEFGHGAVTLGSEIAAGVQNLTVSQCYFRQTDRGLRIKTRRGRGKLCQINNVIFENIYMEGVLTPFVINMWYNCCDPDRYSEYNTVRDPLPVDHRTPHLGSFAFRHIRCVDCQAAACYIDGLPESPIERVEFEDVQIDFREDAQPSKPAMLNNGKEACRMGLYLDNLGKLVLKNVKLTGVVGQQIIAQHCGEIIKD